MITRCTDYAGNVVEGICGAPAQLGEAARQVTSLVSGLFFTALSVVTVGKVEKFNVQISVLFHDTSQVLPGVFRAVLNIIHKENADIIFNNPAETIGSFRSKILFKRAGDLAKAPKKSLKIPSQTQKDDNVTYQETFGNRVVRLVKSQCISRIAYALTATIAIVCRVADLIIGVIAAAAALICLGRNMKINNFALKNLTFFGVGEDISIGLRGIVNPQQTYFYKFTSPISTKRAY